MESSIALKPARMPREWDAATETVTWPAPPARFGMGLCPTPVDGHCATNLQWAFVANERATR